LKTFADQGPRESVFAQNLVLRIDEYNCGVFPMDVHIISCLSFQVAETGLKTGPGLNDNGSMRQFVLP
jgi:hypothetical protein